MSLTFQANLEDCMFWYLYTLCSKKSLNLNHAMQAAIFIYSLEIELQRKLNIKIVSVSRIDI